MSDFEDDFGDSVSDLPLYALSPRRLTQAMRRTGVIPDQRKDRGAMLAAINEAIATGRSLVDVAERLGSSLWVVQKVARQHGISRPRGGLPRISDAVVTEIRLAVLRGETQQSVGNRFGVSRSHVSSIVTNRLRKHQ